MTTSSMDLQLNLSHGPPLNSQAGSYWVSYNKHVGPKVSGNGRTFMITVSLDSGVGKQCEGVRIIIVRKADSELADITISDSLHSKAYPQGSNLPSLTSRDILIRRKNARIPSSPHPEHLDLQHASHPTVFSVVYELVKVNVYWVELVPLTVDRDRTGLMVIYDRAFPMFSSNSLITTLESTTAIRRDPSLYPRRRCGCSKRSRPDFPSLVHSVRIQPYSSSNRKVCPPIPLNIIRSIADFVIQPTHDGWRRDLRAMGFINKAWSCVLDLFFKTYWSNRPLRDRPSVVSVANSLTYRPERARAVRQLFLCHYSESDRLDLLDPSEKSLVLNSIVKILSLANSVKRLEILPMEPSLRDTYIAGLFALSNVEYCSVYADFATSRYGSSLIADGHYRLTVDVILALLGRWSKVSMLDFTGTDESSDTLTAAYPPPFDPPANPWPTPCYPLVYPTTSEEGGGNLRYLTLRRVKLTVEQFTQFLYSPAPRLNSLCLIKLTGLSNKDLFEGLSQVASVVTSISVAECEFPRSSPDEEYALDALMPRFVALQSISVTGDCVNWLSVARKMPNDQITYGPSISIGRAPNFELDKLPEALQTSHWSTVSITCETPMGEDTLARSRTVASEKGMNFWYWHEKAPSPPTFQTIVTQQP